MKMMLKKMSPIENKVECTIVVWRKLTPLRCTPKELQRHQGFRPWTYCIAKVSTFCNTYHSTLFNCTTMCCKSLYVLHFQYLAASIKGVTRVCDVMLKCESLILRNRWKFPWNVSRVYLTRAPARRSCSMRSLETEMKDFLQNHEGYERLFAKSRKTEMKDCLQNHEGQRWEIVCKITRGRNERLFAKSRGTEMKDCLQNHEGEKWMIVCKIMSGRDERKLQNNRNILTVRAPGHHFWRQHAVEHRRRSW